MRLTNTTTPNPHAITASLVLPQALTGLACSPPHDPHRPDLVCTLSPFLSFSLSLTLFLSVSPVFAPAPVPYVTASPLVLSLFLFLSYFLSLFSLFFSFSLIFSLSLLTFQFNHTVTDSLYYYNYTTVWVLYFSYLILQWCGVVCCVEFFICELWITVVWCGVLCWIFYMWIVDCELWLVWFIDFILWSLWPCGWEIENNWSSGK